MAVQLVLALKMGAAFTNESLGYVVALEAGAVDGHN